MMETINLETLEAVKASNEKLVRNFFSLLEKKDVQSWKQLWTEEGIYQIPYDDPAATYAVPFEREETVATFYGRENIAGLFSVIPDYVEKAVIYDVMVNQTTDPEVVYVEFKIDFLIAKTQFHYRNLGIGRMHIRDGKVWLFREYLDLTQRQKGWSGVFF